MGRRRPRRFIKKEEIEERKKRKKKQWTNILGNFSYAYGFGITLLTSMIIGFIVGHYIDRWLNTNIIFTLGFISLGIYISFDILIKEITKDKGEG